jgi:hypothetical protein
MAYILFWLAVFVVIQTGKIITILKYNVTFSLPTNEPDPKTVEDEKLIQFSFKLPIIVIWSVNNNKNENVFEINRN